MSMVARQYYLALSQSTHCLQSLPITVVEILSGRVPAEIGLLGFPLEAENDHRLISKNTGFSTEFLCTSCCSLVHTVVASVCIVLVVD